MSDKIVVIHNTNTGEISERAITAQELSEFDVRQAEAETELQARNVKAEQKAALLQKLNITEDEARLLFS